jgi:hypothetical protein
MTMILSRLNVPYRCLFAVAIPTASRAFFYDVPRQFVLPVVMASAERESIF